MSPDKKTSIRQWMQIGVIVGTGIVTGMNYAEREAGTDKVLYEIGQINILLRDQQKDISINKDKIKDTEAAMQITEAKNQQAHEKLTDKIDKIQEKYFLLIH